MLNIFLGATALGAGLIFGVFLVYCLIVTIKYIDDNTLFWYYKLKKRFR